MKMCGMIWNYMFCDMIEWASQYIVLIFQGIQAQTVANFFLAFEAQLSVIPVINKVTMREQCYLLLSKSKFSVWVSSVLFLYEGTSAVY